SMNVLLPCLTIAAAPPIFPGPVMLKLLAEEALVIADGITELVKLTRVCTPPTESSNKTESAWYKTGLELEPRLNQLGGLVTSQVLSNVEFHFRFAALPPTVRFTCPDVLVLSARL